MKYKATRGFVVILCIAILFLGLGNGRVWSFVTYDQKQEAKEFINTIDSTVTKEIDHSIYKSKEQCIGCHPRASPSHMFSKPLIMSEKLSLDSEGKITCFTCHNCTMSKCVFTKNKKDLCNICHDCSIGMSCVLGVAHFGSAKNIEGQINRCISCHDALVGPLIIPDEQMINRYYKIKKGFRDISHTKVILVSGKITCISCHNPYDSKKKRLIIKESQLCLTCHIK